MSTDIRSKIDDGLEGLPERWAVMLETAAGRTDQVSAAAVEKMAEDGTVIIVTVTKPANVIETTLEDAGIGKDSYHIIDCVSKSQQRSEDTDNITYVPGATSLTDLSIKVSEQIKAIMEDGDQPSLYLDSINSLLMHNDPRTVARFVHGLLTRLRLKEVSGMLLVIEAGLDPGVRAEVAQLCDRIISV